PGTAPASANEWHGRTIQRPYQRAIAADPIRQSAKSSVDFLRRLKLASPIKIIKLLTDNGSQFTDRFTTKDRKPSGQHAFDKVCTAMGIEHRLAPPRHPQTNGMVERFNGRISELLQQTRFDSR
ncbi:hypothetical protein ACQZEU_12540, partial [Corynebacterium diphtheriae]